MMTLVRTNRKPAYNNVDAFGGMLNSFINDVQTSRNYTSSKPKTNVEETENAFILEFAIPGFDKSDVTIKIEKDILMVEGKAEVESERKFTRHEFQNSEFKRTFTLPEHIDGEKVSANFKNGILSVTLPKKEVEQPKAIDIQID